MKILTLLFLVCLSQLVLAQNVKTGQEIFNNSCVSCHGNSGLNLSTPVLHGQESRYLVSALENFKRGDRTDHIMFSMNNIASNLTPEDMKAVAKYLITQDPCDIKIEIDYERDGFKDEFQAGKKLVQEKNCMHCHGSFHHQAPRLIGQKKSFLLKTLHAFKNGTRVNRFMNRFAADLSEDEIKNISVYLSGLRLMRDCPVK
jgi:cytochrome c553